MEAGGPMLRAVLRQLSTAAAIRTVPTPCRARHPGAVMRQTAAGEARTPPLGVLLGLREAVPAWSDVMSEAGSEVWDLDDGFTLPPPLLDLANSELGDLMDLESSLAESVRSLHSPTGTHQEPMSTEMMHQLIMERLASHRVLLPLAAAAISAGGRRFPAARSGPRGQLPKSGGCVRQRQRTIQRQGAPRGRQRDHLRQPHHRK